MLVLATHATEGLVQAGCSGRPEPAAASLASSRTAPRKMNLRMLRRWPSETASRDAQSNSNPLIGVCCRPLGALVSCGSSKLHFERPLSPGIKQAPWEGSRVRVSRLPAVPPPSHPSTQHYCAAMHKFARVPERARTPVRAHKRGARRYMGATDRHDLFSNDLPSTAALTRTASSGPAPAPPPTGHTHAPAAPQPPSAPPLPGSSLPRYPSLHSLQQQQVQRAQQLVAPPVVPTSMQVVSRADVLQQQHQHQHQHQRQHQHQQHQQHQHQRQQQQQQQQQLREHRWQDWILWHMG